MFYLQGRLSYLMTATVMELPVELKVRVRAF